MPDNTDFRVPGKKFERKFGSVDAKGGIMFPDNYKSIVVNIRPKKWQEKFWIGRIDNYVDAQFIADLVYYYIGFPCFHLQNVNFNYPPLECKGTSKPLTSREMCFEYAMSIAKGPRSQRQEFIASVKKLAVEEVKRVEVQRVLQQFRDEEVLAVTVGKREKEEEEDVLGFDMCDTEFQLQSDLSPVGCSWVDAFLADMKDYDGRPNHDAEDFCSATRVLEEN